MHRYFEGNYRRTPQQNLAGASHMNLPINQLVNKAQSQRRKREKERLLTEKAIILQAAYRGHRCRKKLNVKLKEEFNRKLGQIIESQQAISLDGLGFLVQRMIYFFMHGDTWEKKKNPVELKSDIDRFLYILRCMFKIRSDIVRAMGKRSRWIYRVCRFTGLSMTLIKYLPEDSKESIEEVAVILRSATGFTEASLYTSLLPEGEDPLNILAEIWQHLLNKYNVFENLLEAVRLQVKYKGVVSTYTEVMTYQMKFFSQFVELINLSPDLSFKTSALISFGKCIMKPAISDAVFNEIFPKLREINNFPLFELSSVIENDQMTPHCLYRFLYMDKDQTAIKKTDQPNYFRFLCELMFQLYKLRKTSYEGGFESSEFYVRPVLESSLELINSVRRTNVWLEYLNELLESKDYSNLKTFCKCLHVLWMAEQLPFYEYRIMEKIVFNPVFLREVFNCLKSECRTNIFGSMPFSHSILLLFASGVILRKEELADLLPTLTMFSYFLKENSAVLINRLFYKEDVEDPKEIAVAPPFDLMELIDITKILKDVLVGLIALAYPSSAITGYERIEYTTPTDDSAFNLHSWRSLFEQTALLIHVIYSCDTRHHFTDDKFWLVSSTLFDPPRSISQVQNIEDIVLFSPVVPGLSRSPYNIYEERFLAILRCLPFFLDFLNRFSLYQELILELKSDYQNPGLHFLQAPYLLVQIRRNYIYEDALEKLGEAPELRIYVKVHMISSLGIEEPGIDGGGLFREFIIEFLKAAFDPNRGFFIMNRNNELYPNPKVEGVNNFFSKHYYFIGRMLGKAMYENILVEIPLAEFFLAKIVGDKFYMDLTALASLDPVMHRNLLKLIFFSGDLSEVVLDFTLSLDIFGKEKIVELTHDGANKQVTKENILEYVHLVAKNKVNAQIARQTHAFLEGLNSIIPKQWLSMFTPRELQIIISGNETPIDINDLRINTKYGEGYTDNHPTIEAFWRIVMNFDNGQKSQLLKFVTSCSRPPLLGFKDLYPPFSIHFIDDDGMLPSASTCMNILKLPNITDEETLKQKVLYAISSGAGFELI